MRTSLNEIQHIENYLQGKLNGQEEVLFRAKLLLNSSLAENKQAQQKSYQLIRAYGRKQLKQEIEIVHQKLFMQAEHKSFRQKIRGIFGL